MPPLILLIDNTDSLFFPQPALVLEEAAENLPARIGEHLGNDFAAMVQPGVVEQAVERMHRAGLRDRRRRKPASGILA